MCARNPVAAAGQTNGDDELARRQRAFALRRVARQAVELSSGTSRRPPLPSISTTASSAASGTPKSDGLVAMHGFAPAEHGVRRSRRPRVAARAGLRAYCRRSRCRRNTRNACAAADCRRPSRRCELRRGAGQQRLGHRRESALAKDGSCARSALRTQRADPHAAIGRGSIAIKARKARDIDQTARAARCRPSSDPAVGAGRQDRPRRARGGRDGFRHVGGPDIIEAVHAASFPRLRQGSLRFQHRFGDSAHRRRNGRDCRSCLRDPLGVVAGLAFLISPIALMIWPGVQKPH